MSAEVVISADDEGVRAAAAFVRRFAAESGLDATMEGRLSLVVEELVTNLAKYGYPPGVPRGSATLRLACQGGRLTLEMTDDGQPFDPTAVPPPDLDRPAEDRPVGDLGLHLVRSLTEGARYERTGRGNHLTLTFSGSLIARK